MSKFNVGDKVVRVKCSHSKCPIGYVGKVTSVRGCWLSVDEARQIAEDLHPFSEDFFELYEEKQMFDFKNTTWVIYVQSKEEAIAAYEWIKKESGMDFILGYLPDGIFDSAKYWTEHIGFTNSKNYSGSVENRLLFGDVEGDLLRKVIKLTYSSVVDSIEYPEIMTEKEIETKKIREEMEALAERLKKLEGKS